jgi:hypothetical protein
MMALLKLLMAGLPLVVESQPSDIGFMSKNMPSRSDASMRLINEYGKFITPNRDRVKHGHGHDALFRNNNLAELDVITGDMQHLNMNGNDREIASPSMGAGPFMVIDDKPIFSSLHPKTQVQDPIVFIAATGKPSMSTKESSPSRIADREEKQTVQKLLDIDSSNPLALSAISIGLLTLVMMLGVRLWRRLQPPTIHASGGGLGPEMPMIAAPALGDIVMETTSQDPNINYSAAELGIRPVHKLDFSRVGWGQLSSQNSRSPTFCYAASIQHPPASLLFAAPSSKRTGPASVTSVIEDSKADLGEPHGAGSKQESLVIQRFSEGMKPTFLKRFEQLIEFKERLGHVDVPLGGASRSGLTPRGLGNWVYAQRKRKINGTLDPLEEEALKSVGFRWQLDVDELDWDEMIQRLVDYKAEHGNTLVPKKNEADPLLGAWVAACRRKADPLLNGGRSELPPDRIAALDRVDFAWEPERRCGSAFMKGLRAYGDACVAGEPPPDEKWCDAQREARRQGKLSDQRIGYLDKFGFDWDAAS